MNEPLIKKNISIFLNKFSNFPPKDATKKLAQHLLNITEKYKNENFKSK